MPETLPTFVYHPDPLATGSIKPSGDACECCGQARGYEYTGPAYSVQELEVICPWCIADGSAHAKFSVEFTDRDGVGDSGCWGTVPDEVADTIAARTPGFTGWQQERWWVCCKDAAVFLGPAGKKELDFLGGEAVEAIRADCKLEGESWENYFNALDREHGPTAYVFRCRHCRKVGGYSDCH